MKADNIIVLVWLALLTAWMVKIDLTSPGYLNEQYQANRANIQTIREYLEENPGHTHQ